MKDLIVQLKLKADEFERSARNVQQDVQGISKSVEGLQSQFNKLKGIAAASFAGFSLYKIAQDVLEVGIAYDRLNKAMAAAHGSAMQGASATRFLHDESKRLGLVFRDQVDAYRQLAAAARGTSLEGEGVRKIYSAIAEASTALQLTQNQVSLAIYAVQQMMSKGVVSSEELRRQLGDVLPGAFQIASRAMGVTTEEFNKMLESGKVMSADFLPKFANQLRSELGEAATESAKSAQAEINRLKTSFEELERHLAEKVLPTFTRVIQHLNAIASKGAIGIFAPTEFEEEAMMKRMARGPAERARIEMKYRLNREPNIESQRRWLWPTQQTEEALEKSRRAMLPQWGKEMEAAAKAQKEAFEAEQKAGESAKEQDVLRIIEDREKAEKKLKKDAEDRAKALQKEIELQEKIGMAQIQAAGDMEAIIAARDAKEVEIEAKRRERQEKAAADELKKREKDEKDALEKMQKDYEHFLERVHDATADTFYDIFSGTIKSWGDMLGRMKDWFFRFLAEIAAAAVVKPIVLPIIASLMGGIGLGGMAGVANAASGLGAIGGGFNAIGGIGGILGQSIGWGSGSVAAITEGASGYMPAGASASSIGGTSLGGVLGAGALGALGYSTIGGMLGLPQSKYSTFTAGGGAALGMAIGGPIGAGIGALGGGLIGSMFGKEGGPPMYPTSDITGWLNQGYGLGGELGAKPVAPSSAMGGVVQTWIDAQYQVLQTYNEQVKQFMKTLPDNLVQSFSDAIKSVNLEVGMSGSKYFQGLEQDIQIFAENYASQIGAQIGDVLAKFQPLAELGQTTSAYSTSWKQFEMSMMTGDLAPVQSSASFGKYYVDLLNAAKSGGPAEYQALLQYAGGSYLPFMKSFGPGDYGSLFEGTMGTIGGMAEAKQTEYDAMRQAVIDGIKQGLQGATVEINGQEVGSIVMKQIEVGDQPQVEIPYWQAVGGAY